MGVPTLLVARLRRFGGRYVQLLREGLRLQTVILIGLVSVLGALAQAAAIGVLLVFTRVVEGGTHTGITWIDANLGPNRFSLVAVVGSLVFLGVLSALASYTAKSRARALGRAADAAVAAQVLDVYSGSPHVSHALRRFSQADIRQMMVRSPRLCGSAIEAMLHLICPIVYGLTIAWILVRVNPSATLYIVPLFILLLPFLHRFNSRVRQQSRDYYTNATRNQAEFISVVLRQAGAQNIHQDHHRRAIQELFRNSVEIRRFHDSYDHFRLASDRSILITSLFRPVALGFVIAVLGAQALHGHVLWGEIIVYAVALGQLIAHIQTVTTQFTKLNLYYPEVAKYLDFRASQPRSITPAQPVERINLIVLNAPPVGSSPSEPLSLKRGDRAMLVCDLELNRTHLQMIVEPLKRATRHNKGRAAWDRAGFLAESPVVLPLTLAQFILGERSGEEAARRPLIEALDRLGVRDEVNTTLGGLDCVMEPAVWKAMSGTCRAVIRLLSAAADSQEVVIVDWRILSRVDVARLGDVLGILEDRVVLISTTDVKAIVPTQFVSTVLILQGSSFVAAGDAAWWTASGLRHRLINARFLPTEQSNLVEPDEDMQM